MSDGREREEALVLRAEFGAELDAEECRLLADYLRTPEGRAVRRGVRATRALVGSEPSGVGDDAARLRARFEQTLRAQARATRRRFLGLVAVALLAATGVSLFFGHVLPRFASRQPGPEDLRNLWLLTHGAALALCAYLYLRLRRLESVPDLFDRLTRRERRTPRTLADHLVRAPLYLLLTAYLARREGWAKAALSVGILWVVFALAARLLRARLRRSRTAEDEELWSWWYGEAEKRP